MSKVICKECGQIASVNGDPNQGGSTYGVCFGCKGKAQMRRVEEDRRRREEQRLEEQRNKEASRDQERRHKEASRDQERRHRELLAAQQASTSINRTDDFDDFEDNSSVYNSGGCIQADDNNYYDDEVAESSYVSQSNYYEPKKRSCLGCTFKMVILLVVGFFAIIALGIFLDEDENIKSGSTPAEPVSPSEASSGTPVTPAIKTNEIADVSDSNEFDNENNVARDILEADNIPLAVSQPTEQKSLTQATTIRPQTPQEPSPSMRIAELKGDLAAVEARIQSERQRWQEGTNTINRLTNFKRTPVREGSPQYHQCVAAAQVIQQVEAGAPALKAEKARLEAMINSLEGK